MSVLDANWPDLTLVTGRALTWMPGRADRSGDRPSPSVREGVVDLFVERARETGTSVERIDQQDLRRRDDARIGHATLGVATAGCVVLTAPRRPSSRVGRLVPNVCVLRASTLVFGVPEAVALLDRRRDHTWVRGAQGEPDLELDRVGRLSEQPGLHVLLVG